MTENFWLFVSLLQRNVLSHLSTAMFTALSDRVQMAYGDVLETEHRPPGFGHRDRVEDTCQVQGTRQPLQDAGTELVIKSNGLPRCRYEQGSLKK